MIDRIATPQAHPVPDHTYYSSGPSFDAALYQTPKKAPEPEIEHPDLDLVRCTTCRSVLRREDAEVHVCG